MTVLPLAAEFLPQVQSGQKTSTVRRGTRPYRPGPAVLRAGRMSIAVSITEVAYSTLEDLTDRDAQDDGFDSRVDLVCALRRFYPSIEDSEPVTIIRFVRP